MEGRKVMDWQAIWFILAGFVLGFATSTLWEWLYYRRQRLRAQAGGVDAGHFTLLSSGRQSTTALRPPAAEYRSPGVFLESERPATPAQDTPADPPPAAEPAPWHAVPMTTRSRRSSETPLTFVTALPQDERHPDAPRTPERRGQNVAQVDAPADRQDLAAEEADHEQDVAQEAAQDLAPDETSTAQPRPVALSPPATQGPDAPAADEPPETPAMEDGATPPAPPDADRPDNFARIKGIGRAYRQRLYHAGIATWQQLVDSDAEQLRQVTNARSNTDITAWQAQAQTLMEKHNRQGAAYHGPPPDDLTAIPGIGPTTLDVLYSAGIYTYRGLAEATPDQLRDLLPAPAVGVEVDYERWIGLAERLAGEEEAAS